jgi:Cd2+/Zn2+-exporting ATPase/Cu+-exporting ATPase
MAEEPQSPADEVDHGGIDRLELLRIVGTAVVAAAVWFRVWEPFPRLSVLGLLGTLIGGWPIFHEAWKTSGALDDDGTVMTIALLAALAIASSSRRW